MGHLPSMVEHQKNLREEKVTSEAEKACEERLAAAMTASTRRRAALVVVFKYEKLPSSAA